MLKQLLLTLDWVPILSALSVTSAIFAVAMPYMQRDTLSARMARVAGESEDIRRRSRGEVRSPSPGGLAAIFGFLANRVDSPGRAPATGDLARRLQMAGIRGTSAVPGYIALRALAAAGLCAATFAYLQLVLRLDQPLPIILLMSMGGGIFGFLMPSILLKNRIIKRQQAILRAWPNALDLMLICVESGMAIDQAMRKVAEEIGLESVDLAEEMTLTVAELSYLPDRRQAFENLSNRTGLDAVKAVVASLKQAERHGTSLGTSLRVLSQENRDLRLAAAEKKAAALPPKLTVPMILFFLPVLFAVIIAPAVMQVMAM